MPDMHRPRRICRDEFNIDLVASADPGIAIGRPGLQDRAQLRVPHCRVEPDVQKPRPRGADRKAAAAIVTAD